MHSARPHRYSVYILGSIGGTLYIGITSNLLFRVRQHKEHTFRGFTAEYELDRSPHRYSVYILGSIGGTLYIGITSNLLFRVRQHKEHTFRGFTAEYEVDRLLY